MNQDYYFSTVRFGGFDKEEVLLRLKELVEDYEEQLDELNRKNEELQNLVLEAEAKTMQLEQSCLTLRDKNARLMEYNELLNTKCTEKGIQLKEAQDRCAEMERNAATAGNTSARMLSDTQAQCKQMLQEAKATSQAIIVTAVKDKNKRLAEMETEYQAKRKMMISLVEDFEAFQHYIETTHSSLKKIVDQLPNEMKDIKPTHE